MLRLYAIKIMPMHLSQKVEQGKAPIPHYGSGIFPNVSSLMMIILL